MAELFEEVDLVALIHSEMCFKTRFNMLVSLRDGDGYVEYQAFGSSDCLYRSMKQQKWIKTWLNRVSQIPFFFWRSWPCRIYIPRWVSRRTRRACFFMVWRWKYRVSSASGSSDQKSLRGVSKRIHKAHRGAHSRSCTHRTMRRSTQQQLERNWTLQKLTFSRKWIPIRLSGAIQLAVFFMGWWREYRVSSASGSSEQKALRGSNKRIHKARWSARSLIPGGGGGGPKCRTGP